jgi:hypothetical protein
LETSAKQSINVEDAFINLAREIKNKVENKVVAANSYENTKLSKSAAMKF